MCLFTHWTLSPWGTGRGFCSPLCPQHPAEGWAGSESLVILSCSANAHVEPQLPTLDLPSKPSFPPSLPSPLGSHGPPGSSPTLFSKPPPTTIPAQGHSPGPVPPPTDDHLILLQHPQPLGAHAQAHRGQAFRDPPVWELPDDPLQVHFTNLHM